MDQVFQIFDEITALWFTKEVGEPTQVQREAWTAIASGCDALVSAPTGTGKTLSAFLVFIDRLNGLARENKLNQELYLIYVSPLKSLAGDIRENLKRPLNGILRMEHTISNHPTSNPSDIQVAIRTGDTTQQERRRMIKKPPHILIITPESLYLMLTSKNGQKMLKTAKAIIIDELHALIDSKRGAHLMLTIARLDALCGRPLQRIGLSATIEPLSLAAKYLSPDEVKIVAPKMKKKVELKVISPLQESQMVIHSTIWNELARTVYQHCKGTRSVIAFVDGRMYAEKLAYYVNQYGGEGFARTHHGSLSKEQRFEVEQALREGKLRLLCATSSMELGIDVGDVDQVFQVACPKSISSTMQRLGRAGHNPGRVSVMHIFPRTASEGLYCGITAQIVREGGIEACNPPTLCLDILAQHLVSMAAGSGYEVSDVMNILPRAYPFQEVTIEDVRDVLCMLAGDYEHERDIPVRPRVLYDRIHDKVEGDTYSRMLAINAGGTIPDKGMYTVKTAGNIKLGELDEEFVYEARIGDKFLLGTFAWKIKEIQKDAVIVSQTSMNGAQLPFWKGDIKGRGLQTGMDVGRILRHLYEASQSNQLQEKLSELGLDERAAKSAKGFIERQLEVTNVLPDDKTIVIEHFHDETENHQMMVHSVFGRQINAPLSLLVQNLASRYMKTNMNCVEDDDGFLLFPYGEAPIPKGLLKQLSSDTARSILEAMLPSTPVFNITFRYNIAHALMTGAHKSGRQPLWIQRIRSAQMLDSIIKHKEHPIIRETKRECLQQLWDITGVEMILSKIHSGDIKVYEMDTLNPSPMSLILKRQTEASMMYEYTPTPLGITMATQEALKEAEMLPPTQEQLERSSHKSKIPEDEKQLHTLLMMEGDMVAGEVPIPIEWLESLLEQERVSYIEPGLWIAAEHAAEYEEALVNKDNKAQMHLIRRALRYRGAKSLSELAERYLWSEEETLTVVEQLVQEDSIILYDGLYYHAMLYERAQQETIKVRRVQNTTYPAQNYVALLMNRNHKTGTLKEQLEQTIKQLCGYSYPAKVWESVILPGRVSNYRPELLDMVLAQGEVFWKLKKDGELTFYKYEEIDWDRSPDIPKDLSESEMVIYEALLKRGATFTQGLSNLLSGTSAQETLLSLTERGLVCADSFSPVRQWLNKDKLLSRSIRQRVNARVAALTAGRFEISHSTLDRSLEQKINRLFDEVVIICRETVRNMTWQEALSVLRIWEYTGKARRGYFIKGLSGIQFIRESDYAGTILTLGKPELELFWIPAIDPAQPYGKCLAHIEERSFMNVPTTVVAMYAGRPVAVLEQQGKVLRCFEEELLPLCIKGLVEAFERKRIFPGSNRLIIKQYTKQAVPLCLANGFIKEIQDLCLYRK